MSMTTERARQSVRPGNLMGEDLAAPGSKSPMQQSGQPSPATASPVDSAAAVTDDEAEDVEVSTTEPMVPTCPYPGPYRFEVSASKMATKK